MKPLGPGRDGRPATIRRKTPRRSTACRVRASTAARGGGDRAAGRQDHRAAGPALAIDRGAEQRVPRRERARGRPAPGCASTLDGGRFVVTGMPDAAVARAGRVAGAAGGEDRGLRHRAGAAAHRRSTSRGTPAWTPAGRSGCSRTTASSSAPLRPADVKAGALEQRFDVLILARRERAIAPRRLPGRTRCRRSFRAAWAPTACRRSISSSGTAARSSA